MSNECMSMPPIACRQACPYNTLKGCRVKELDGICPLTNVNAGAKMPLTNADRIRAMTDEELGRFLAEVENRRSAAGGGAIWKGADHAIEWLQQPVKED